MTSSDELLRRNTQRQPRKEVLPTEPAMRIAIVACMDSRIDMFEAFGLRTGEAHVLRNAGGVVTDDVVRSLAVSQRKLGTREIMLMHHTRCGLLGFTEGEFKDELEQETGIRPHWSVETFTNVEQDVRQSVERVKHSPFLALTTSVRGFVHDVDSGELTEVR